MYLLHPQREFRLNDPFNPSIINNIGSIHFNNDAVVLSGSKKDIIPNEKEGLWIKPIKPIYQDKNIFANTSDYNSLVTKIKNLNSNLYNKWIQARQLVFSEQLAIQLGLTNQYYALLAFLGNAQTTTANYINGSPINNNQISKSNIWAASAYDLSLADFNFSNGYDASAEIVAPRIAMQDKGYHQLYYNPDTVNVVYLT